MIGRLVALGVTALVISCSTQSCLVQKPSLGNSATGSRKLVAEMDRGWAHYEVYRSGDKPKSGTPITLSIRVFDKGGESPLRKISSSLQQYNEFYEYLLNRARYDLLLVQGQDAYYPTAFIFENGYRALPFETIVVTYTPLKLKRTRNHPLRLLYLDKVFSHDTLSCLL